MAVTIATGDVISEAETPELVNVVVTSSVDYKGRASVRSKSGCWKSASFILVVEMAERLSYYGISSNLVSYLTGVLGQSTAAAAANLNAWYGVATLTPILGAFVADSFLGRYQTIIYSSLLYILGLGLLTLSAVINSSDSKSATNNMSSPVSQLHKVFFFFSFYLVALAQGGHLPCLQAFGADQFDEDDQQECKAKSSFFNWWNWFSSLGILIALLVLNYIQENLSWEVGFGIPTIVMCFSLIIFWIRKMNYRFHVKRDGRHSFVRICCVFIETARRCRPAFSAISNELKAQRIVPQESAQSEFLDVALLEPNGTVEDEKMCSIDDVEEAKTILRLVPIWFTSLGFSIIFAQPATLFTKQAATLDLHLSSSFQIPAASLQICIILSVMAFLPIYDRVLVPIAMSITKRPSGISMLQRIGIGLFVSLVSIIIAALVEMKRLEIAREHGLVDLPEAMIPMSVWWLIPQYALSGIADVFSLCGLQEFFYDQVSSELKSTGLALYLSILGVGSFFSSFLVYVVQSATTGNGEEGWISDNLNRAHLDYFYWLLAGISAFSFVSYIYFARSYVYSRRNIV